MDRKPQSIRKKGDLRLWRLAVHFYALGCLFNTKRCRPDSTPVRRWSRKAAVSQLIL